MHKYLYVLDYSTPSICEIKLEEHHSEMYAHEILHEYGLDDDECSWMFTDRPLGVTTINKIEK